MCGENTTNRQINLNATVFRVNITHNFKAVRKSLKVACILQDVSIFMKVSGIPIRKYFASDQKWISCTTRADPVAEA